MNTVLKRLVATDDSLSAAVIRLFLGLVILPHGLQKTLGLFGGYGFTGTMGFFTGTLGVPAPVAFLVLMAESLGALSLIFGFATRFSAASLILIMLGAVNMAHWSNGFFMNWTGTQKGEGFEYHLLVIGMALAIVIAGAGKASIDRILTKRLK
jgi:putative oxidoreductase